MCERCEPAVVHVAGAWIHFGGWLRQRCAWCGALILNLENGATVAGWPPGHLVAFGLDQSSWDLGHVELAPVPPPRCCLALDPAITA